MLAGLLLAIAMRSPPPPPPLEIRHILLHRHGWSITVTQPSGWLADTQSLASFAGAVFRRRSETLPRAQDVITVQFLKRDNGSARGDLVVDIARYKRFWPRVRFGDFTITAGHGNAFGKLYYLTPTHTEAVVYLDPGPGTPCFFIVDLVSFDRPPPADARAALRTIVGSLLYVATTPG
jgi:hypothetical protein